MSDRIVNHLFFSAAKRGDADACLTYLKDGADVHSTDEVGETALHAAAREGHDAVCKLLIQSGAKLDATARGGRTPLHIAAVGTNGHAVIRLLIESGADIHAKTNIGETPLHNAALVGSVEACKMLISFGADARMTTNALLTPLHNLAWSSLPSAGQIPELVDILLNAGGDLDCVPTDAPFDYLTPFQYAIARGNIALVKLCVESYGVDVNQKTLDGRSLPDIRPANDRSEVKAYLFSKITEREVQAVFDVQNDAPAVKRSSSPGML